MGSNSEIQGYNFYSMLHFHRKFSSSVTAQSVADLWMIGGETEQSFVRRRIIEPLSLVFSGGYLLLPSPCSGDNFVYGFVPSNNCQK